MENFKKDRLNHSFEVAKLCKKYTQKINCSDKRCDEMFLIGLLQKLKGIM
jgi:HD superfamily phosphohydrolase YqeK